MAILAAAISWWIYHLKLPIKGAWSQEVLRYNADTTDRLTRFYIEAEGHDPDGKVWTYLITDSASRCEWVAAVYARGGIAIAKIPGKRWITCPDRP